MPGNIMRILQLNYVLLKFIIYNFISKSMIKCTTFHRVITPSEVHPSMLNTTIHSNNKCEKDTFSSSHKKGSAKL